MIERRPGAPETVTNGLPVERINPDRVKVRIVSKTHTEDRPGEEVIPLVREPRLGIGLPTTGAEVAGKLGWIAAASLALTAVTSVPVERETLRSPVVREAERPAASIQDFYERAKAELDSIVSVRVIHQFTKANEAGEPEFNTGGLVLPFAFSVTTEHDAPVTFELEIPYDWARTFKEIKLTNPAAAEAQQREIVAALMKQIRGEVVMHGILGVTDSAAVWNAQGGNFTVAPDGSIVPPPGAGRTVDELIVTGRASAEAEVNNASTLGSADKKNEVLAENRARDYSPLIREALTQAGFDVSNVQNFEIKGEENILRQDEIARLAAIAGASGVGAGSPQEQAIELIYAYNRNPQHPGISPEDAAFLHSVLNDRRGVTAVVRASGTETSTHTFNVALVLPLLAALFFVRKPGGTFPVTYRFINEVLVTENTRVGVARRLFDEERPADYGEAMDTPRSFQATYESIDLGRFATHLPKMQHHLLAEEVLPSLNPKTREPFIDYVKVAREAYAYMHSDTDPRGRVKKGRHMSDEDAQYFAAEKLVEMWEHHDQALYPMEERDPQTGEPNGKALDLRKMINYRYSKEVVLWAKLLAEQLVKTNRAVYEKKREAIEKAIAEGRDIFPGQSIPIITDEDIETALLARAMENAVAAQRDGHAEINVPVTSDQPTAEEYTARVR